MKPEKLVDIHSHIMFGVDDGADDMEMTIDLIKQAEQQNITHMFITPHSWGRGDECEIRDRFALIKNEAGKRGLKVELYLGREIACDAFYLYEDLIGLENGSIQSLNDTKYVLVEFLPSVSYRELLHCLNRFKLEGWKPIVAHCERYPYVCADNQNIQGILDRGCLLQMNAYSVGPETNSEIVRAARNLLAMEAVSFIGSDAHHIRRRPVAIKEGVQWIYDNCSKEYADKICWRNAEDLLKV